MYFTCFSLYIVVLPYIMCVCVVEIYGTSVAINFFLKINSASTDEYSVLEWFS